MNVVFLTREYPPDVYGGAGVHIEHLAREMAHLASVEVRAFGDRPDEPGNPAVRRFPLGDPMFDGNPHQARRALETLLTCLQMNADPIDGDVVHCHTWYSHFAGLLARYAYGIPMVVTVHSLEPLRPWKREQLGRGYDVSSWVERTAIEAADAVITVSDNDRGEVLSRFRVDPGRVHFVPNGIDTDRYRPVDPTQTLARHGVSRDRPYVLFVGRITRQKGIMHFLRAARHLSPEVQVVLLAAEPDTAEIGAEVETAVAELQQERDGVVWVPTAVTRDEAIGFYSGAAVFCCPSVYEPFGLINLEAMACETAVVGTAVGGIPEIVVDGETGYLVPFEPAGPDDAEPADPAALAADLAAAMTRVLDDPAASRRLGGAGRKRAIEHFGWPRIAARVHEIYQQVVATGVPPG